MAFAVAFDIDVFKLLPTIPYLYNVDLFIYFFL